MALAPTHTPPAIPSSIYALIAGLIQATHPVTARALACLLPRRAKQKTGLCFWSVWASFNRFRLGTYNTTTPIHTRQQRTLEIRFPMRTKSKSRNQNTTTQLPNTIISFIFIYFTHFLSHSQLKIRCRAAPCPPPLYPSFTCPPPLLHPLPPPPLHVYTA